MKWVIKCLRKPGPSRGVKKCGGRWGKEMRCVVCSLGCDIRGLHCVPKRDGCASAGKQLFDQLSHWQMLHCVWALRQRCDNLKCVWVMLCFRALALSRDIWHISDWSCTHTGADLPSGLWRGEGPGVEAALRLHMAWCCLIAAGKRLGFFLSLNKDFSEVQRHN